MVATMAIALALAAPAVDHGRLFAPWFEILSTYSRDGRMDYAALRRRDADKLAAFIATLGRTDPSAYFDEAERFVFWINAYNAFAVASIVARYPIRSVRDDPTFFTARRHKVAGKPYSLDEIEKRILRERFADPRMHFALVCGAASCPVLDPALLDARTLDRALEAAARRFVADDRNVRLDGKAGVLHLSAIFQWFEADFVAKYGSVEKFLARYLPPDKARRLRARAYRRRFQGYDWSLNRR